MKTKLAFFTKLTCAGLDRRRSRNLDAMAFRRSCLSQVSTGTGPLYRCSRDHCYGSALVVDAADWRADRAAGHLRLVCPAARGNSSPDSSRTVGKFAAGIWIGAVLQIVALLVTDIAGLAATVQNYRRRELRATAQRWHAGFLAEYLSLMGILVIVGGAHVDKYHNLMHLIGVFWRLAQASWV